MQIRKKKLIMTYTDLTEQVKTVIFMRIYI